MCGMAWVQGKQPCTCSAAAAHARPSCTENIEAAGRWATNNHLKTTTTMLNLTFSTHTTSDSKAKIPAGAVYSPVAGNPNQVAGHFIDPATGKMKVFVATKKPAAAKQH